MGEQELKNIARPVRIYRLKLGSGELDVARLVVLGDHFSIVGLREE